MSASQDLSLISLSGADFRNWSERELVSFCAEFQSELVLMMTMKKNCYLSCVICDLSGSSELVVKLVQVSSVSWVSHDAVLPVPGKSLKLEQQRCFCILLSVPVFGLCSDLPNQISLLHAVVPLWGLFPDVNPRCSGAKILNRIVSASGQFLACSFSVIRCPERCDATRSMCVSRDTDSIMIAELGVTRFL